MTTTLNKSALVTALLAMSLAAAALLPAPVSAANAPPTASAPAETDTDADTDADTATDSNSDHDSSTDDDDSDNWTDARHSWNHRRRHGQTNDIVAVGHDSNLPVGAQADSVVAVFGSATNNGTANEDVVSVFGDTTVNGPVTGSSVAVLGNNIVNADVGQDVVAVLGSVTLGPKAHVHGQVVSVLGTVTQDPAAIVDRGVQRVLPESLASAEGLRVWLGHGLMLGRPLVFGTGTQWLWGIAFTFLAVYTLLALLFRDATEHCIETLNEHPGKSLITAILAVLLTPLLLTLLVITIVGVLAIPIAMVTLFCAAIFGKTTVLGWIGGRCFGVRPGHTAPHPALAVIVGGLLIMLAYLVPLLGLVVFILLGMLGYGAVLYAIFMRIRHTTSASRAAPSGTGPRATGGASGAAPFMAAPAAAAPDTAFAAAGPEAATTAGPGPSSGPGLSSAHAAPGAAPAAAQVPLSTYPRAGFWIRMGALFIDAIIVSVLLGLLMGTVGHGDSHRVWLLGLATYGAVMWKFKGTTIGGALLHLQVTRLDSRALDWPTVWVRALGCILSLCALCLGFIWIAVDPEKQGWHDKLAGTIVVRTPKGIPLV